MEWETGVISLFSGVVLIFLPLLMSCAADGESNQGTQIAGRDFRVEITTHPGIADHPVDLKKQLESALRERGSEYIPRTHHLRADGTPIYTNRLILSSSPYLHQHAHNPVNWYPWGDEAFETAAREGKPVLLSVGYSTCHWCHVMEEESFEDEEIARYMNENYVAIKVDREERPDVDSIYMASVQALSGRGGWPMTVWLTPERQPFYGGTYFPARDGDRGARKGFLTILRELHAYYQANPEKITEMATQLTEAIRKNLEAEDAGDLPRQAWLDNAAALYQANHDPINGGLRRAPKFPSSLPVRFLFRHYRRTGNQGSLRIAVLSLEKMAAGGMYDQVGGGFHRYSTDETWLVPHFEKMLYDNALLIPAYLEGYQITGREDFARTARETLDYVLREMTAPDGGFYSATDADSEGEEGTFFLWTADEIREVLGAKNAPAILAYYGVTDTGNFEGKNILYRPDGLENQASRLKMTPDDLRALVEKSRSQLYEARSPRIPPFRDEKILTAWNGLMITAFCRGYLVLQDPRYLQAAEKAAGFLLENLRQDGRLLRSYLRGKALHNAYLDDYAFLIGGLIDLYEVTFDIRWLREAIDLQEVLEAQYRDAERGGYFQTSKDHEELLVREKPDNDGAVPSGNSVAILNLLRLHEFTTEDHYRQLAEKALRAFGSTLSRQATKLSEMLTAVEFHLDQTKEIVIIKPNPEADAGPLLAKFRQVFLPNRILTVASEGPDQEKQERLIPLMKRKIAQDGKVTAYVCENRICALPTSDPEIFARQISRVTAADEGEPGS